MHFKFDNACQYCNASAPTYKKCTVGCPWPMYSTIRTNFSKGVEGLIAVDDADKHLVTWDMI